MTSSRSVILSRRSFLGYGVGGLAVLAALPAVGKDAEEHGEDISPAEDLMREHGVTGRLLLVYAAFLAAAEKGDDRKVKVAAAAASLVKRFVHEYHETLEDEFVFPRFRKAEKLAELVRVLHRQHEIGRVLTDDLLALSSPGLAGDAARLKEFGEKARIFAAMYAPHAAREDTVVFPALRDLMPRGEYAALGERFEEMEHARFGKSGFAGIVEEVAALEEQLGIHELGLPPVSADVLRRSEDRGRPGRPRHVEEK